MSPRIARLLIACCLALALPLQGVAAATMLWCQGGLQDTQVVAHHADTQTPPCHEVAAADEAGGDAAAQHTCATCAACCVGGALLPAGLPGLPGHAPAGGAVMAPPQAGEPGYITGGPERPPRPFLD